MVPMPKNLNELSSEEIKSFLGSFDTVLCDCDGVLWLEDLVIENSENTVNKFIEQKKKFFYVTNNSVKLREEYAEKCNKLGFVATKDNIICTSYLAAEYLKSLNFDKKVYIIGGECLGRELDRAGIRHFGIGPDVFETNIGNYIKTKLDMDPEVGAVLVGFDQHFSYPKMMKGAVYLSNPNCHFIGTCPDESYRANSKLFLPGTGCFVRCMEAASGRKAFILGKPSDFTKSAIMKMENINPSRTLMIGDRCNTDILFGRRCGFKTLLVFTGVTSLSDVEKYANSSNPSDNEMVPEFCINKLGDLLPHM